MTDLLGVGDNVPLSGVGFVGSMTGGVTTVGVDVVPGEGDGVDSVVAGGRVRGDKVVVVGITVVVVLS